MFVYNLRRKFLNVVRVFIGRIKSSVRDSYTACVKYIHTYIYCTRIYEIRVRDKMRISYR